MAKERLLHQQLPSRRHDPFCSSLWKQSMTILLLCLVLLESSVQGQQAAEPSPPPSMWPTYSLVQEVSAKFTQSFLVPDGTFANVHLLESLYENYTANLYGVSSSSSNAYPDRVSVTCEILNQALSPHFVNSTISSPPARLLRSRQTLQSTLFRNQVDFRMTYQSFTDDVQDYPQLLMDFLTNQSQTVLSDVQTLLQVNVTDAFGVTMIVENVTTTTTTDPVGSIPIDEFVIPIPPTSALPTMQPTLIPTMSLQPSLSQTETVSPSVSPTRTATPTLLPSRLPTLVPTVSTRPSGTPSLEPSHAPTFSPSHEPSSSPSYTDFMVDQETFEQVFLLGDDDIFTSNEVSSFQFVYQTYTPLFDQEQAFVKGKMEASCTILKDGGQQLNLTAGIPAVTNTVVFQMTYSSRTVNVSGYTSLFLEYVQNNLLTVAENLQQHGLNVTNSMYIVRKPMTAPPTTHPTTNPSVTPTTTLAPSASPSVPPTRTPSDIPSHFPTLEPTPMPSQIPTLFPTLRPTVRPSILPTVVPTPEPTPEPSRLPTFDPTTLLPSNPPTDNFLPKSLSLPPSLENPSSGDDSNNNSLFLIAIMGLLTAILLTGMILLCCYQRRQKDDNRTTTSPTTTGKSFSSLSNQTKDAVPESFVQVSHWDTTVVAAADVIPPHVAAPEPVHILPLAHNHDMASIPEIRQVDSNGGAGSMSTNGLMMVSPTMSLASNHSLFSAGNSMPEDYSEEEADTTQNLQDEFDLYKDQNLERFRAEVEGNLTDFDGIVSHAVTHALIDDEEEEAYLSDEAAFSWWGGGGNLKAPLSGTEIESSALCDTMHWLKRNEHASVERKRIFMQRMLNKMVSSVHHGILGPDDASRSIHECAALLNLPLATALPVTTLIVTNMPKYVTSEDVIQAFQEFGDIDSAAVATNQRGFGIVRFKSPKSTSRAMRKYRHEEIVVLDVGVVVTLLDS